LTAILSREGRLLLNFIPRPPSGLNGNTTQVGAGAASVSASTLSRWSVASWPHSAAAGLA
jgi:hypothetical protein